MKNLNVTLAAAIISFIATGCATTNENAAIRSLPALSSIYVQEASMPSGQPYVDFQFVAGGTVRPYQKAPVNYRSLTDHPSDQQRLDATASR